MSELLRIPSTLATSRISTLWFSLSLPVQLATVTAARNPDSRTRKPSCRIIFCFSLSPTLVPRSPRLKAHYAQNPFDDQVRGSRAFADNALAFDLDLKVSHAV